VIGGPFAVLVVAVFAAWRRPARWVPIVVPVLLAGAALGATVRYRWGDTALLGINGMVVSGLVVGALAALAGTLARDTDNPV
jgi:hypothetical protein